METMYGLGCLPYEPSDKDYQFNDLISCAGEYPNEYVSPLLPSFRLNQGTSSMCAAFAIATARYMYEINDSGNMNLFSPAYIYSKRRDGDYKGEGMVVKQALSNLIEDGVCYWNSFSDIGDYKTLHRKYTSRYLWLDEEAKPYRISSYYFLKSINEIKQAIVTTGFAVVSYDVYDNWYTTGTDGNIGYNYGKNYGGHCVLIVGWTRDKWILLNSWGENWGDNGIGYISMTTPRNECWCVLDNIQEMFFTSLRDIQNHWAADSINKAAHKGIIKGYEDLTFKPNNALTRVEACFILAKISGYEDEKISDMGFIDVPNVSWYKNYVVYCKKKGLISGYTDGTFRPMSSLTRAETAKVLCLISGIKCVERDMSDFNDVPQSHWAFDYINTMKEKGVINGYEDGSFKPDNNITRAEFIVMIDRLGLI